MSNIIFQVMSYMDGDINIIHGNEKLPFWSQLQSRELNLVLRKTAMIVRERYLLRLGQFRKSPDFLVQFGFQSFSRNHGR